MDEAWDWLTPHEREQLARLLGERYVLLAVVHEGHCWRTPDGRARESWSAVAVTPDGRAHGLVVDEGSDGWPVVQRGYSLPVDGLLGALDSDELAAVLRLLRGASLQEVGE